MRRKEATIKTKKLFNLFLSGTLKPEINGHRFYLYFYRSMYKYIMFNLWKFDWFIFDQRSNFWEEQTSCFLLDFSSATSFSTLSSFCGTHLRIASKRFGYLSMLRLKYLFLKIQIITMKFSSWFLLNERGKKETFNSIKIIAKIYTKIKYIPYQR